MLTARRSLLPGLLLALTPFVDAQFGSTLLPGSVPNVPGGLVRRFRLTDHAWIAAQSALGPVQLNGSIGGPLANDGNRMRMGGRSFPHGIGTAATSLIRYDVTSMAATFSSWVGVDDEVGNSGSVVFQVIGDGMLLYDSGVRTGADAPLFTGQVAIGGVRVLDLVVTDAGDGHTDDHADWGVPVLTSINNAAPFGNGTLVRYLHGSWESPLSWPVMPIHATLLPTGQILSHASSEVDGPGLDSTGLAHDSTEADLADIATWQHQDVDHPSAELFAAGHARCSDGRVLTLGGHAGRNANQKPLGNLQATHFDPTLIEWIPARDMRQPRHGASALTLGNGDVLALGGAHGPGNLFQPEVFDGVDWRLLPGVDYAGMNSGVSNSIDHTYPFAHLASDGRVFWGGWDETMGFFDTIGSGTWTNLSQREARKRLWGVSVLHEQDQVLMVGGVDHQGSFGDATSSAIAIDLQGATPIVSTVAEMLFPRADANGVLLADGTVVMVGGACRHSETVDPSALFLPEVYDPVANSWSVVAPSDHARAYLSTALLLPDGRVWTGGGVGSGNELSAQVWSPPYLYAPIGLGQLATRPTIVTAPADLHYDEAFDVELGAGVSADRVTLVRLGSATHGRDFEQRFLELSFVQNGVDLSLTAPLDGNAAPPGPYMLFVFDDDGVPSTASIVQLNLGSPTSWQQLDSTDGSVPANRHETAMVEVGGRMYLMGGRGTRPVEVYDPVVGTWTNLGLPPLSMHHYQPLEYSGQIWVVSAFTGNYPNETNVGDIHIFDPATESWSIGAAMPAGRNRGSAGVALFQNKFYLIGGNTLGHNGGAVAWFDEFDPLTQTWTALPDAPHARDHFHAIVVGNKLVAAGGRETDLPVPSDKTVAGVDIYDFSTGSWSTSAEDIPTERAGTMSIRIGQHVVVAGGESDTQSEAHDEVEALDVLTGEWFTMPELVEDRHSGGIAVHDSRIYIAAGSGTQGGSPELDSLEVIDAVQALSGASTNKINNSGFQQGMTFWIDSGDLVLSSQGGIDSPALEISQGFVSQRVGANPAASHTLSAIYRASGGAGDIRFAMDYLDAGSNTIGTHLINLFASGTLNSASLTGTSPVGTVSIRVRLETTQNRVLTIDDISLIEN
ncbi:MAG: hypothetical protein ACI841_002343 [Planctomycetota bacterium]|jgi:hypothetical protein